MLFANFYLEFFHIYWNFLLQLVFEGHEGILQIKIDKNWNLSPFILQDT